MRKILDQFDWVLFITIFGIYIVIFLWVSFALARDHGQFAASSPERKAWFQELHSDNGPCCADADGNVVLDADWESKDGHYRVRLEGEWVDVPDTAVVKTPNLDGRTIVWPIPIYQYGSPHPVIRCFMPGSMT